MKLLITFKRQLSYIGMSLLTLLIFLVMIIIAYRYISNVKLDINLGMILLPFILFFIWLFFPVFFIHFNYYQINKDNVIYFYSDIQIIRFNQDEYKFSDIEKIIIHLTGAKKKGESAHTLLSSEYYYCELLFNDNKRAIISCLMADDLLKFIVKNFPENIIDYSEEIFPIIK
ncbi:hypothetical protein [Elizabethkingia ursingii]|uniref:PH domain-containing protein n=1 Tax=Elizabethkingia ursingii TaxID=1756150 RepID=A0ABX3NB20_9FLAO|nr:hypothetical protein [Elizabethkingia ursingii]OPB91198.1 hypothetical protein BB021_04375 [Elizabethkingia ursingii]